ncbi:ALA-interacting subunit 1 [Porphyridium purpureum]|uniref:ALA-interacting subunit 1 n=1 Tax=Porphyridium purpureum TaxID=35688 RepID=A0A5J4Z203_PORPP|nr:ALA-interacting subunit 1 [Porphyridium purpureum]|eukprot:POR7063..scf208_2
MEHEEDVEANAGKDACCCPGCGPRKARKKGKNKHASQSDMQDEPHGPGTKCYKFRQQELWALTPILSPKFVIAMYLVMACVCIPIGAVILARNGTLASTAQVRYDNIPECDVGDVFSQTKTCTVEITIEEDIEPPAYFYYRMSNYFQNVRTYTRSRSSPQLAGQWPLTTGQLDTCEPILDNSTTGTPIPCGLTAWSVFNDTFVLCEDRECNNPVPTTQEGIEWPTDSSTKFKAGPTADSDPPGPWTDADNDLITSTPFMVWMRLAAFSEFNKLNLIVQNQTLTRGTYYVQITNNYPVSSFDGTKSIIIFQVAWYGSANSFLGIAYVTVGALCVVLAVLFLLRVLFNPRRAAYDDPTVVLERINDLKMGRTDDTTEHT